MLSLTAIYALSVLAGPVAPAGDPVEDLAKALREYREAYATQEDVAKARAALDAGLAALGKAAGEPQPLRLTDALGRAQWLSLLPRRPDFKSGKVEEGRVEDARFGKQGLEYAFHVPRDYEPDGPGYPLILSLPGDDEGPAEHLRSTWSERDIRAGAILLVPSMPAESEARGQVTHEGLPGGITHVLTVLRAARSRFAIDPERIVLVGNGAGAGAALAAGNFSPQVFAGVVVRSGDVGQLGADNFGNLPVLLAAAGQGAAEFAKASEQLGHEHCEVETDARPAVIWEWASQQRRATYPETVTVVPGNPFPTRAYWLRVTPIADGPRVSARLDRAANAVEITALGVSSVSLYLNDALLDLDRPVSVKVGETEREYEVRRSWDTLWRRLEDGTSDSGCIYTAELLVDLSGDAAAGTDARALPTDPEVESRLLAAGEDAADLWAVYLWCVESKREDQARRILQKVVRADPDHAPARAALGHVLHDGRWFRSQAGLDRYLWTQDEASAKSKGHVLHKGEWMHRDERSLTNKQWTKDPETGQWLTRKDRERLEEGWERQDLEWIEPTELDALDRGLWRVQGGWLDLAQADLEHAALDSMWVIPDAEVLLHTTLTRETAGWALAHMSRALWDLRRVFGAEPPLPLRVAMLRDQEQYDRLAFGATDGRRAPAHAGRMNMVHHAFFAESLFRGAGREREFAGMGVGYWEVHAPNGNAYGVHAARLAVALAYVEALDPSPLAVRNALAGKLAGPEYVATYEAEKRLPAWLRAGGAVFAERYFFDATVDTSVDSDPPPDPYWARTWSLENLAGHGGLRPLDELFEFRLDPAQRQDAQRLMLEAGLLVSFLLDGDCAPASEAHAEFRRELAAGRLEPSHLAALESVLREHEAELRAYAEQ